MTNDEPDNQLAYGILIFIVLLVEGISLGGIFSKNKNIGMIIGGIIGVCAYLPYVIIRYVHHKKNGEKNI